jgi:hypothetical protein
MADKKISALTAASTPLAGTEVLPIVQSSATVKVSAANITADKMVDMLKQWPSNNEHSIYNALMINHLNIIDAQLIANDKPAPI